MSVGLGAESATIIQVWTDGACSGNPGPGGWAYVATFGERGREKAGRVAALTTNVAMEMVAVIQALRSLKRRDVPCAVFTDSELVVRGMNEWLPGWEAKGWRAASGKPVANRDLWEAIAVLVRERTADAPITFAHVRGHSGDPGNERADVLAQGQAQVARKKVGPVCDIRSVFDPASGLVVREVQREAA